MSVVVHTCAEEMVDHEVLDAEIWYSKQIGLESFVEGIGWVHRITESGSTPISVTHSNVRGDSQGSPEATPYGKDT